MSQGNKRNQLQDLLGESKGQVIPTDIPKLGLTATDVAGGPRGNFVDDTSTAGKSYLQIAKALGEFGTEGIQNLTQGYIQEAENQVTAYKMLTPEEKKKHTEDKEALNKYYRELGVFGLNPIARNAIEKLQGGAYASEFSSYINDFYENLGLAVQGNPLKNPEHQDFITNTLEVSKGKGIINSDKIREANAYLNKAFLLQKEDVLTSTAQQAGLIESLVGIEEKLIEDYPSQFNKIQRATAVGMFGEGIHNAYQQAKNPYDFTEFARTALDMAATFTKTEADEALDSLKAQFLKQDENEIVTYDGKGHVEALEYLVGHLQYGNKKLSQEDILPFLAEAQDELDRTNDSNRRKKIANVSKGVAPMLNQYDEQIDAYIDDDDLQGVIDLEREFEDKIREKFTDPEERRMALDELETYTSRARSDVNENIRAAEAIEARQERKEIALQSKVNAGQQQVLASNGRWAKTALTEKPFIMSLRDRGLDTSRYFFEREEVGGPSGLRTIYEPNSEMQAIIDGVRNSMDVASNAFIRGRLEANATLTHAEALAEWEGQPRNEWIEANFEKMVYGELQEQRDKAFNGNARIQEAFRSIQNPDDQQTLSEAFSKGNEDGFFREYNNILQRDIDATGLAEKYSIKPSRQNPTKVTVSASVRNYNPSNDNRDSATKNWYEVQSIPNKDNGSIVNHHKQANEQYNIGKGAEEFGKTINQYLTGLKASRFGPDKELTIDELNVQEKVLDNYFSDYGLPIDFVTGDGFEHNGVQYPAPPLEFKTRLLQDVFAGDGYARPNFKSDLMEGVNNPNYLRELAEEIYHNENVFQARGMDINQIEMKLQDNMDEQLLGLGLDLATSTPSESVNIINTMVNEVAEDEEMQKGVTQLISESQNLQTSMMEQELAFLNSGQFDDRGVIEDMYGFSMRTVSDQAAFMFSGFASSQFGNTYMSYNPNRTIEQADQDLANIQQAGETIRNLGETLTPFIDIYDPYYDEPRTVAQNIYTFFPDIAFAAGTMGGSTIPTAGRVAINNVDEAVGFWAKTYAKSKAYAKNANYQKFRREMAFIVGGAGAQQFTSENVSENPLINIGAFVLGGAFAVRGTSGKMWGNVNLRRKVMGKNSKQIIDMMATGKLTEAEVSQLSSIGRLSMDTNLNIDKFDLIDLQNIARRFEIDTKTEFGIDIDDLVEADIPRLKGLINDSLKYKPKARLRRLDNALFGANDEMGQSIPSLDSKAISRLGKTLGISRRDAKGQFLSDSAYRQKIKKHYEGLRKADQINLITQIDNEYTAIENLQRLNLQTIQELRAVRQVLNGTSDITALPTPAFEQIFKKLGISGSYRYTKGKNKGNVKPHATLAKHIEDYFESLPDEASRNAFAKRLQAYQDAYNAKNNIPSGSGQRIILRNLDENKPKPDPDAPPPPDDAPPPTDDTPPPPPDSGGPKPKPTPKPDTPPEPKPEPTPAPTPDSGGSEFKPTVKHSKTLDGAKKMEADGEGIDVHRKLNTDEHYGNPFSHLKQRNSAVVKVATLKDAVDNYKKWLAGTDFQDVNPKQREWIIKQVDEGALDNQTLLYYKRQSPNHAEALSEFVAYRKDGGSVTPKPTPKNNKNVAQTQQESGDDLFKEQVDKFNRDKNFEPDKADPREAFKKGKDTNLSENLLHFNWNDRTKDLRYTKNGRNPNEFEGVLEGTVTGKTFNIIPKKGGGFNARLAKAKKGDVITITVDARDPKARRGYIQVTGVARTKSGKGLTAGQIDKYSRESGKSKLYYQEQIKPERETIHVSFRVVDGNFSNIDEARAVGEQLTKKINNLDGSLDFSKVKTSVAERQAPAVRAMADKFRLLNKLVGDPYIAPKGKNPKSLIGRAYKAFAENRNVGVYESGDRVGIFIKNIVHKDFDGEVRKVFNAQPTTIITDTPTGKYKDKYFSNTIEAKKYKKLEAGLKKYDYEHQGGGVWLHKDAIADNPNVKRRKVSDLGPDEQSKPNTRQDRQRLAEQAKNKAKEKKKKKIQRDQGLVDLDPLVTQAIKENVESKPKVRRKRPEIEITSPKQAAQDARRKAMRESGDVSTTLVAGKRRGGKRDRDYELEYNPDELVPSETESPKVIPARNKGASKFDKVKGLGVDAKRKLANTKATVFKKFADQEIKSAQAFDELSPDITKAQAERYIMQPKILRRILKAIEENS